LLFCVVHRLLRSHNPLAVSGEWQPFAIVVALAHLLCISALARLPHGFSTVLMISEVSVVCSVFVLRCSQAGRLMACRTCLQVIRNGQMLGVRERRNRNTISTGSMAAATIKAEAAAAEAEAAQGSDAELRSGISVIGEVDLLRLFNDGGK
jgi:hypothetical protein